MKPPAGPVRPKRARAQRRHVLPITADRVRAKAIGRVDFIPR